VPQTVRLSAWWRAVSWTACVERRLSMRTLGEPEHVPIELTDRSSQH